MSVVIYNKNIGNLQETGGSMEDSSCEPYEYKCVKNSKERTENMSQLICKETMRSLQETGRSIQGTSCEPNLT